MAQRRRSLALKVGLALFLVAGVLVWRMVDRFRNDPALMADLRAGMKARSIADPDARLRKYLEERYGNLEDPAIRRRVFVEFFDPERIRILQMLVRHAPEARRQSSVDAMARWLADYRTTMTPEEATALNAQFQGPEGRALLQQATAQYNSQDVQYRGQTAGVISELLRTLNEVEQNNPPPTP